MQKLNKNSIIVKYYCNTKSVFYFNILWNAIWNGKAPLLVFSVMWFYDFQLF